MGRIELCEWDSKHFGVKIGRYAPDNLKDIGREIERAKAEGYELLITRLPIDQVAIVNHLESLGFRVKDILVLYRVLLDNTDFLEHNGISFTIRSATPTDIDMVADIARTTFKNYRGHFHADELLSKEKCDELYVEWAINSIVDRKIANEVFIAEGETRLLGFATIKIISDEESQGILFGTAPEARGRGVYSEFIKEAINWSKNKKLKYLVLGTQVNNYVVQNAWTKVGAKIFTSYYTLHLWLGKVGNEPKTIL